MSLLDVRDVSMRFGGLQVLDAVNLRVHSGEIVGLIGPNGAGKTTLFNCISGLVRPTKGRLQYKGEELTSAPPHARARRGIARTFQRVELFANMTALENVLIGAEAAEGSLRLFGSILPEGLSGRARQMSDRAMVALDIAGAGDVANRLVGALPLGLARRVELARALASAPDLLLLDEPMSGLDEEESRGMAAVVSEIRAELGVAVLIVEHDVPVVVQLSDYIYVLDFGQVIAGGTPTEVVTNPSVITAYLGTADALR